jgi:hypothetical protein
MIGERFSTPGYFLSVAGISSLDCMFVLLEQENSLPVSINAKYTTSLYFVNRAQQTKAQDGCPASV